MHYVANAMFLIACTATTAGSVSRTTHARPETAGCMGMMRASQIRGGARDDGRYSFSLTTYSPEGKLNQLEYAMNSALVSAHRGVGLFLPALLCVVAGAVGRFLTSGLYLKACLLSEAKNQTLSL